jgi:hypothetical protein
MRRIQTYEQWRQEMLNETARFIEWGLMHSSQVPRIPTHPVGDGKFPGHIKRWFWEVVFHRNFGPPGCR